MTSSGAESSIQTTPFSYRLQQSFPGSARNPYGRQRGESKDSYLRQQSETDLIVPTAAGPGRLLNHRNPGNVHQFRLVYMLDNVPYLQACVAKAISGSPQYSSAAQIRNMC